MRTRLNQGSWRMSGPRLWRTTGRWHSAVTYSRGCWERRRRRRRRSGAKDRRRFREMDAIPAPAASSRGGSGRWCQWSWVPADRRSGAVAVGDAFARIISGACVGDAGPGILPFAAAWLGSLTRAALPTTRFIVRTAMLKRKCFFFREEATSGRWYAWIFW